MEVLSQALNVRNREGKYSRFGFSTSEDAVTWVVFTHLLRSGHLPEVLNRAGLVSNETMRSIPTLLLWGVPIGSSRRGLEIRQQLTELCVLLGEDPNSFSEPDVIVDFGTNGLLFIEVKHHSGNDWKASDYRGWSRYSEAPHVTWQFDSVKASGCYELARNWCFMNSLAGGRPATLINLGPAKLFDGAERARLENFVSALGANERARFKTLKWSDFLSGESSPEWFVKSANAVTA